MGDLLRALDAEEREALEAASVVGVVFSTQSVAAGLGLEPDTVEQTCTRLVRGGRFVEERGVERWPDGMSNRAWFEGGSSVQSPSCRLPATPVQMRSALSGSRRVVVSTKPSVPGAG